MGDAPHLERGSQAALNEERKLARVCSGTRDHRRPLRLLASLVRSGPAHACVAERTDDCREDKRGEEDDDQHASLVPTA